MNVAFVSTKYINKGIISGGLPNYLNRTAKYLVEQGNNVVILYLSDHNAIRIRDGIKLVSVKAAWINNMGNKSYETGIFLAAYTINKRLTELIKTDRIDIVQFTSLNGLGMFYDGDVPAVMRLSSYTKLAFVPDKTISQEDIDFLSELERESSCNMDGVFAPSKVTADCFAKAIGRNVEVIESPFFVEEPALDDSIYTEKLQGKIYFLFFGVLYFEKGITDIAEIIYSFMQTVPDIYFVVVGKSLMFEGKEMSDRLKDATGEYAERLIYFPELSHRYLYPIIQNAEFVVLPSRMENFSNACIEAMHFGKVVIGTNGASFEQLIDDGVSGLLCEIGDPSSLLKKMLQASRLTESERKAIGEKARERIDLLRPEITVNELLEYYRKVIDSKENNRIESRFVKEKYDYVKQLYADHRDDFIRDIETNADKRMAQYKLTLHWLKAAKKGMTCSEYFVRNSYRTVAIYGMFDLGQMLFDELRESKIEVAYGVDRSKRSLPISVYSPDDNLPEADVLVVTAISDYNEIYEALKEKFKGDIVSLEDVIYDMIVN